MSLNARMTDDELADSVWGLLEDLGHADGLGGMEYQRVMTDPLMRRKYAEAGQDFIERLSEAEVS